MTPRQAAWNETSWSTWWRLNQAGLLPDRRAIRRRASETKSASFFQMGEPDPGRLHAWDRRLREGAKRTLLPFLLDLTRREKGTESAVLAAGLIALGRTAQDATPIPRFERYALDVQADLEVRESAVLALGLLRRTDRAAQQSLPSLCRVRTFLLHLFDDKDAPDRLRCFAMYALALLGDQPFCHDAHERDGRGLIRQLWRRLDNNYPSANLPVSILTALGYQPRAGMPTGVMLGLRSIAAGKPFFRRKWDGLTRSHALTAYVRLEGTAWVDAVLWTLRGTRDHVAVRAAAAIALQEKAATLDDEDRVRVARSLRRSLPREAHWMARGLGQMALGCLLREDLARGRDVVADDLRIGAYLADEALEGRTMTRPFAALALGLSVHGLDPSTKRCAVWLKTARETLHRGLRIGRGADEALAAYAVGLGLARGEAAHADLLAILQDRHRSARLRGHAAVALAQMGRDTAMLREALNRASQERVSPLVHTGAVRALSLLAPPETTTQLLEQFGKTRSRYAVAVIAGALGGFGDPDAAEALLERARNRLTPLEIRTMSVVALGLIFDPEPRPSRTRLTTYANYPSRTPALSQIFNIQ